MDFSPRINNKKWQLWLIPLIAALVALLIAAASLTDSGRFVFPWRLFITLCVFIYCIWQVNLLTYRVLDKRMVFYEAPGKRILVQLLCCFMATWVTFTLLYLSLRLIRGNGLRGFDWGNFLFFFLVAAGISLVINLLYIVRYLQSTVLYKEAISTEKMNALLVQLEAKAQQPTDEAAGTAAKELAQPVAMVVTAGAKTMSILFTEMAYWYSSEGLVILVLTDGKMITTNFSSFASFAAQLPTSHFFQLSRQFIAHVQSIVSITDDSNRKLIVALAANKSSAKIEEVTVSRYRSQALKDWFARKVTD